MSYKAFRVIPRMRHLQQLRYIDAVARIGSIRRAADSLAITSTALNRRILAVEEDLGTPIFERLPNGVRLSVAGELFIQHVRQQLSDMERLQSQIADLSGERRGHVSIISGQALMMQFLPDLISRYRADHPGVSFSVFVGGRQQAVTSLMDFSADLAFVYESETSTAVQVLHEIPQQLHVLMSETHPLADETVIRLSDCSQFPLALPSQRSGIRHVLMVAAAKRSMPLAAAVESDSSDFLLKCIRAEPMLAFQIPVAFAGTGPGDGIRAIPLHPNDLSLGKLRLTQQRGRHLPVAAGRFAAFIAEGLVRLEADAADEQGSVLEE